MNIDLDLVRKEVRRRQRQALSANVPFVVLDNEKGVCVEKQPNGKPDRVIGRYANYAGPHNTKPSI